MELMNSSWLIAAGNGIYKDANALYGNPSLPDSRIDSIFINTEQSTILSYDYWAGELEHFSDHKPLLVKVEI